MDNLRIRPISLKETNDYVEKNHRHHRKATGHKYSLAVYDRVGILHGIAIVGRPVNRFLDDGKTLEVLRLCTDGTYNACSILYARCARVAKDMGYCKIITYVLQEEKGSSLRASGWLLEKENVGGGSWEKCSRREEDLIYQQESFFENRPKYPIGKKKRYSKLLEGK